MSYANEPVCKASAGEAPPLSEIMDRTNERLRDSEEIIDQLVFAILGTPALATGQGPIENLMGAAMLGHETAHSIFAKLDILRRGIFPQSLK